MARNDDAGDARAISATQHCAEVPRIGHTVTDEQERVTVLEEHMLAKAAAIHEDANAKCFIARSVNFPVEHDAVATVAGVRDGGR